MTSRVALAGSGGTAERCQLNFFGGGKVGHCIDGGPGAARELSGLKALQEHLLLIEDRANSDNQALAFDGRAFQLALRRWKDSVEQIQLMETRPRRLDARLQSFYIKKLNGSRGNAW